MLCGEVAGYGGLEMLRDGRLYVEGPHGHGAHVYSMVQLRLACLEQASRAMREQAGVSLIAKVASRYVAQWRAGSLSLQAIVVGSSVGGPIGAACFEAMCRISDGAQ